jgi:hypothetical protein
MKLTECRLTSRQLSIPKCTGFLSAFVEVTYIWRSRRDLLRAGSPASSMQTWKEPELRPLSKPRSTRALQQLTRLWLSLKRASFSSWRDSEQAHETSEHMDAEIGQLHQSLETVRRSQPESLAALESAARRSPEAGARPSTCKATYIHRFRLHRLFTAHSSCAALPPAG